MPPTDKDYMDAKKTAFDTCGVEPEIIGPMHYFGDIIQKMTIDNAHERLKQATMALFNSYKQLQDENARLRKELSAHGAVMETTVIRKYERIEKRFYNFLDHLLCAPKKHKDFADNVLLSDREMNGEWDKADAEEIKIRAIARDEIKSHKL